MYDTEGDSTQRDLYLTELTTLMSKAKIINSAICILSEEGKKGNSND